MKKTLITIALTLATSITLLTGCGQTAAKTAAQTELSSGGTLIVSVNPEIGVAYDGSGIVTEVTARNDDALPIIESCENLVGKETHTVISELVTAIGQAGYFVEEAEGEPRRITLEIEPGSSLPDDAFLNEIISDVHTLVDTNHWSAPLNVKNESTSIDFDDYDDLWDDDTDEDDLYDDPDDDDMDDLHDEDDRDDDLHDKDDWDDDDLYDDDFYDDDTDDLHDKDDLDDDLYDEDDLNDDDPYDDDDLDDDDLYDEGH